MRDVRSGPPIVAAFLVVFACAARADDPPQNASDDLHDTSWQLVRFQAGDGQTLAPGDPAKYTLAFEAGGGVSIRIDCNRGHGTWKSAGPNQIELGPLALTRAMCPPAPLSDRIPRDWEHVRSYVLKDGHLFLSLMADGGTYEFEPVGAQGTGATGSASENSAGREPSIPGLPATFVGMIPCADCPGIRYQVNLFADHTFSSRMTYSERNTSFDDSGSWQFGSDERTVLLQGVHGAPQKLRLRDKDTLRMLDADGHEIESKLNYDLERTPAFAPIEPSGGVTSLENTNWRLTFLGDTPVATASKHGEPYLILDSKSRPVSGWGGCNRLTGNYQLGGEHLTFGHMARTLMACTEGMDTEEAFLKALSQTKTWEIEGQQLDLLDGDGHLLARLEAR